jgi:CCT motif
MTTNDEYSNGNVNTSFFDRSMYDRNESIDLDGLLSLSSNIVLEDDGTGATFKNDSNVNTMDLRKNGSTRVNHDIPSVIESVARQENGVTTRSMTATNILAEEEKDDDENDTDDNIRSGSQQVVSLGDDDIAASSAATKNKQPSGTCGAQHLTLDGELFETFDDRYDDTNNNNFDDFSYTSSIDNNNNTGSVNIQIRPETTGSIPIPNRTEDNRQPSRSSQANSHDSTGSGFLSSMMVDPNVPSATSTTNSVAATSISTASMLLSHTPPVGASSDELLRMAKRSRSGSISGRLRSASEFLQENQRKIAAAAASSELINTSVTGTNNTKTATLLKDLIIAEDSELQNALDQYEEHNDASALEEMITSGALQNRLPPDLDLLGDLDLDFLTMDDNTNATTAGTGIDNEKGLRSNVSSMPVSPSNMDKYQYYYPSPSPLFGNEDSSVQPGGGPLLPTEPESVSSEDPYQKFSLQPKRQQQQLPQGISTVMIESGMPSDSNDGIDDDASLLLQIRKSSNASSYLGLLNNNSFYNSNNNKNQHDKPYNKSTSGVDYDDGIGDLDFTGDYVSEQSSSQQFVSDHMDPVTKKNQIDDSNNEYSTMPPSGRTTPQSMTSQEDYMHDDRLRSNSLFSALFGDNSSVNNPTNNPNQQNRAQTRFDSFGSWLEASGRAGPIVSTIATTTTTTLSSSIVDPTVKIISGSQHASSMTSGAMDVNVHKIAAPNTGIGISELVKAASDVADDSSDEIEEEGEEEVEDIPTKPVSAKKAAAMELAERKRREKQEKREAKEREKELVRIQKMEEKEQKKREKLEKKLLKDQEKKSSLSASGKKKNKDTEDIQDDGHDNSMDVDDDVEYEKNVNASNNQQSQQPQPYEHISGSGRPRSLSDPLLRTSIDDETGLIHVDRPDGWIGAYSPDSRKVRLEKFLAKRDHRVWIKTVKYDVRKNFADSRLRVKGRFVKKEDELLMRELLSLT